MLNILRIIFFISLFSLICSSSNKLPINLVYPVKYVHLNAINEEYNFSLLSSNYLTCFSNKELVNNDISIKILLNCLYNTNDFIFNNMFNTNQCLPLWGSQSIKITSYHYSIQIFQIYSIKQLNSSTSSLSFDSLDSFDSNLSLYYNEKEIDSILSQYTNKVSPIPYQMIGTNWLESSQPDSHILKISSNPVHLCARINDPLFTPPSLATPNNSTSSTTSSTTNTYSSYLNNKKNINNVLMQVSIRSSYLRDKDYYRTINNIKYHYMLLFLFNLSYKLLPYFLTFILFIYLYYNSIKHFLFFVISSNFILFFFILYFINSNKKKYIDKIKNKVKINDKKNKNHIQDNNSNDDLLQSSIEDNDEKSIVKNSILSLILLDIGCLITYLVYYYFELHREIRNNMLNITISLCLSIFIFPIIKFNVKFFYNYLWFFLSLLLLYLIQVSILIILYLLIYTNFYSY